MRFTGGARLGIYLLVVTAAVACSENKSALPSSSPAKNPSELVTPPPSPSAAPANPVKDRTPGAPTTPAAPVTAPPVTTTPPVTITPPAAAPVAATAIPLKWITVATLEVHKFPDKMAHIEVGVEGRTKDGKVECALVDTRERSAADSKWLPLPLNIFNPNDPNRRLSKGLRETLDFPTTHRDQSASKFTALTEFVRGRIFRAMWQGKARMVTENGKPACTAHLELCLYPELRDGKYQCSRGWRQILRLITVIDTKAHIYHLRSSEREKNDLSEMLFHLKKLEDGVPTGESFEETFRDFVEE